MDKFLERCKLLKLSQEEVKKKSELPYNQKGYLISNSNLPTKKCLESDGFTGKLHQLLKKN